MIPSIEEIVEGLLDGRYTREQATVWLNAHADRDGALEEQDRVIGALCQSLALAHDEILSLQNVPEEQRDGLDWPEWSHPANSIRWAERSTGLKLHKRDLASRQASAEPKAKPSKGPSHDQA